MSVRIVEDGKLGQWIVGMTATDAGDAAEPWEAAVEVFFDRTQAIVHVRSGNLKRSGDYSVDQRGDDLEATVEYGADYALYEHERGGDHAFLQRAFLETQDELRGALPAGFELIAQTWA